jgi:hypothetical protein
LFTVNWLGLTSALRRCLGATNLIDNGHSAARDRMRRVKHCQSGGMAPGGRQGLRGSSKGFRRIMGYNELSMLRAILDERDRASSLPGRPLQDRINSHFQAATSSTYRRDILRRLSRHAFAPSCLRSRAGGSTQLMRHADISLRFNASSKLG